MPRCFWRELGCSTPPPGEFYLELRHVDNNNENEETTYALAVEESVTIAEVKAKIQARLNIPVDQQRLFFTSPQNNTFELQDQYDLADYHIDSCFNFVEASSQPTMHTSGRAGRPGAGR